MPRADRIPLEAGHLGAYRAPGLASELSPVDLLHLAPGTSVFAQPRHLKAPMAPEKSWWGYDGAICMVLTGVPALGGTDLALPVRLPQGSGAYPHLYHHLGDPDAFHKVDLVRHQDASEPGGWRYE
ncbi:MAG: transposase, partial [Acidimicrobiales bacterium]